MLDAECSGEVEPERLLSAMNDDRARMTGRAHMPSLPRTRGLNYAVCRCSFVFWALVLGGVLATSAPARVARIDGWQVSGLTPNVVRIVAAQKPARTAEFADLVHELNAAAIQRGYTDAHVSRLAGRDAHSSLATIAEDDRAGLWLLQYNGLVAAGVIVVSLVVEFALRPTRAAGSGKRTAGFVRLLRVVPMVLGAIMVIAGYLHAVNSVHWARASAEVRKRQPFLAGSSVVALALMGVIALSKQPQR